MRRTFTTTRGAGTLIVVALLTLLASTAAQPRAVADSAPSQVWAWGDNTAGQVNPSAPLTVSAPLQPVSLPISVSAVAAGDQATLALSTDGTVWTWGTLAAGQPVTGPSRLTSLHDIVAITAGGAIDLALDRNGTVWQWCVASSAALNNCFVPTSPEAVNGLPPIAAIAAGQGHGLALTPQGAVWAWGANERGQVNDATAGSIFVPTPVQVSGLPAIRAIAAGALHSLALDTAGHVWQWGAQDCGMGPCGETCFGYVCSSQDTAVHEVANLADVRAIAGGDDVSFALTNDGTVWSWGVDHWGDSGQIMASPSITIPAPLPSLAHIEAIAAGLDFALALGADGTVWAWGNDQQGQLAQAAGPCVPLISATNPCSAVPLRVTTVGDPMTAQIAAGYRHGVLLETSPLAMATATSASPAATVTNTSTAVPAPTATPTSVAPVSAVSATPTSNATTVATPTARATVPAVSPTAPIPAPTRAAVARTRQVVVPLTIQMSPTRLNAPGLLTLHLHTSAYGQITALLRIIQRATQHVRGHSGLKSAPMHVLYRLLRRGRADRHGALTLRLPVAYRPAGVMRAQLVVTVRAHGHTATATRQVLLQRGRSSRSR